MNDEKTTELEIPRPVVASNIVRVNFTERRKATRAHTPSQVQTAAYPLRAPRQPVRRSESEWATPWWVRLAALVAILILSLFVL